MLVFINGLFMHQEILNLIDNKICEYSQEVRLAKDNQGMCYGYAMGAQDALIGLRNKLAELFENQK